MPAHYNNVPAELITDSSLTVLPVHTHCKRNQSSVHTDENELVHINFFSIAPLSTTPSPALHLRQTKSIIAPLKSHRHDLHFKL